jgi:hypothetical protein
MSADHDDPLATGWFAWRAGLPLVQPYHHHGDHCYSVKDPSVVRFDGRWHLFCTIRSERRTHQIEYRSFAHWSEANRVRPQLLNLTNGYYCAPQVFYFAPQKKWYLIYQVQDPARRPTLQPAYSTTKDLADPKSWTPPRLLFDRPPENVRMWIDFWVICDRRKAHLFFTSHAGWLWRSETSLEQFPHGWSRPEIVLRGDIFEAPHVYRLSGQKRFLAVIEAQEGSRRYLKAFVADRLDGSWQPLAATRAKPLASFRNVRFDGEAWADSFSHPEFLRAGCDQQLELDPADLRLLFQGTTNIPGVRTYGEIPWRLGLLTLDTEARRTESRPFPYHHWTVSGPIFRPGPAGAFDEVAVKDPSIVRYGGQWHLFYTSKPAKQNPAFTDGVGYVAAETWDGLQTARRYNLNKIVGATIIAPQIFYFRPHRLWYLIAQTPNDKPSQLDPIYLTNPDLADPYGWSKPRRLKTNRRHKDRVWIDFWVICDERKAHLFYTDHAGSMYRLETPIARFPEGFAHATETLAVTVRGHDAIGPWRLHEASHIYFVKDEGHYCAILEAVRPHPTKRNYWDSRNRFVFAMIAEKLEGPWRRVEEQENDFLGVPQHVFEQRLRPTRYDQISHPELIRSGYDERLAIKDYHLRLLFQAFDAENTPDHYDYNELPWELLLMWNY